MTKKIIQILCHTLNNDSTLNYHIYGNWSARTAKKIVKETDDYECEVWYAVNNYPKKRILKKDNIVYKLYPARTLNKGLESFYGIISSPQLISDLGKEDPSKTIILFQGERGSLMHDIIRHHPSFHYAIQYHGYGQPSWLDWVERILIYPIEKKTFPIVSHFFVHISGRIQYLKKDICIPPKKISFQNVGVDFNIFKPRNQNHARKMLDLPIGKFIVLYVGGLVSTKGVDKIIRAVNILKKKHSQLFLLLIGGQTSDPLYKYAKKYADKLIGTISNSDLPRYYNAADVYCFFGNKKTITYAGIGTAPTEALASNLNLISTNLIHLPNNVAIKSGLIPKKFTDLIKQVEFLIRNPKFQLNPRPLIAPYTSSKHMTKHLLDVFDKLLQI